MPCEQALLRGGQLVRLLQPFPGLVHRALGVVVGLHRQAVLIHGAVPLAGDVKDFAQRNVAPNLSPARLSVAAERIFVGSSAYNASKHGALGFTDTLREELRPKGIRVIALLPGATDTEIWQTLWPKAPRRKMMTAESVAQIVIDALRLPANTTVEKIIIRPSLGTLEN